MTITRKKLDAIARGGSGRSEPTEPGPVLKAKQLYREIGEVLDMSVRIMTAMSAFLEMRELENDFRQFAEEHFDIKPEDVKL